MPDELGHNNSEPPETIPLPVELPIHFQYSITVLPTDIDGNNHVNNVVYLKWVQSAATAHWFNAAGPEQIAAYAWVALRHELDYLSPAYLGDELIADTCIGEITGVRFERFVVISRVSDQKTLSKSRSIWVAIDPESKKPKRVSAELKSLFFHSHAKGQHNPANKPQDQSA